GGVEGSSARGTAEGAGVGAGALLSAQQTSTQRQTTSLVDKEARKIDALAKRAYAAAALAAKATNYTACMGAYVQTLMEGISPIVPDVSDEVQRTLTEIRDEAHSIGSWLITTARNVTECTGRAMSASIALRRHAWLRGSDLNQSVRATIEDMPIDGSGLFHADTDERLNKRFRMACLHRGLLLSASVSALGNITKDLWFATVDLKDAYFYVGIRESHRRFLAFAIGFVAYHYNVLPFDLAIAPRVFTKCMAPVIAYLHQRGLSVFPYLDDWLLTAPSRQELQNAIHFTLRLLSDLGLVVNLEKSHLTPSKQVRFIGSVLDSEESTAYLPQDRFQTLSTAVRAVHSHRRVRARNIQVALGHMASTTFVTPWAQLRLRPLQSWFLSVFNPLADSPSRWLTVPRPVTASLEW
ncbi:uncharacterized protein LOC121918142, partial [Sceloporus undulatus]|uniref:uncharacterized protein LOC121918142 n=1 Tax=Sceloporus undulatus TaxID=8520 RepID=UPI001C4AB913